MKHLITISLLLFSFCSFGQTVGELRFDTAGKIWKRGPVIETFNPIIFWHSGDQGGCEQLDSVKSLTIRGYSGPLKLTLKVCQHIYVAVEQPEVNGGFSTLSIGHFGKHEGKEIVCIKCHHVRKQIVDYGQAGQLGPRLTLETRPEDIHNVVPPKEH